MNGSGLFPPADATVYRELFGGSGSARLRFGAVAAISAVRREEVLRTFVELAPPNNTWLGALLYEQDENRLRAELVRHNAG